MISCEQHDYIEIACLYKLLISLELKQGDSVNCKALDTQRNEAKQECILVENEGGKQLIPIGNIARMIARKDNPHFDKITFS